MKRCAGFFTLVDGTRTLDQLVSDLNAAIGTSDTEGGVRREAVAQNFSACWQSSAYSSPEPCVTTIIPPDRTVRRSGPHVGTAVARRCASSRCLPAA